jgi:opacity protein-like surface antigen
MLGRIVAGVLLALGITALSAVPAVAQVSSGPIAVKAGFNISNLSIDEDLLGIETDGRAGMLAGVSFSPSIRDAFSLQIEALVTQKGATVDDFDGFGTDLEARINYLELPVLGRYTFRLNDRANAHLLAGPAFSFRLSDTQELGDIELEDGDKIDVAGFDFGFVLGGAFEVVEKWIIDLRYTWGLSNVNAGSALFPSDIVEAKNRTFSVSVGYRFK